MNELTRQELLAVDPGRSKWGWAVVDRDGNCLLREVTPASEAFHRIQEIAQTRPISRILLGDRTGSAEARRHLEGLGLPLEMVSEHMTTLIARQLYRRDHPPRGWRRLVPQGLLMPDEPLDGYAAEALALRFLGLIEDADKEG
jgi:hypothetical protein